MGNFKSNNNRFNRRDRSSPGSSRNRGGRDRNRQDRFDRRDRGSREMTDVICSSCNKKCQVPFKPSTDKPVFCSDCFEKQGNSSRNRDSSRESTGPGISSQQFKEINAKLDKILQILNQLEIVADDEENEDFDEEDEDDDESEEEGENVLEIDDEDGVEDEDEDESEDDEESKIDLVVDDNEGDEEEDEEEDDEDEIEEGD